MKKISDMSKDEYIEGLEAFLFDLLYEDYTWYRFRKYAPLSKDRLDEMESIVLYIKSEYPKKHGI